MYHILCRKEILVNCIGNEGLDQVEFTKAMRYVQLSIVQIYQGLCQ